MKRRQFIQSSAVFAAALASTPIHAEVPSKRAEIHTFNPLGKTGIQMSDISFGAGQLSSAALFLRAIDRGINYFDTAPDYGPSETFIGEALKRYKSRDKIHIASKFCQPIPYQAGKSHLQAGSSVKDYIQSVEGSLKRLGTDYLDVVFVHAMGEQNDMKAEKARLFDENMFAAADALKRAGKMRFLAVSSHGPHNMEPLMLEAVQSGRYDLIMMAFNFMKFPRTPEVLREAKNRGVGVIAMKTLAGARESGVTADSGQFEHAAFKWVLQHKEVSGLVVTFKSVKDLDLYLPASGEKFVASDQRILDQYAALHSKDYCRTGCGDCSGACPKGVDMAAILRYQMYFENYGHEKRAMQSYAALSTNGQHCMDCLDEFCTAACSYGLAVGTKLKSAHQTLTFAPVA